MRTELKLQSYGLFLYIYIDRNCFVIVKKVLPLSRATKSYRSKLTSGNTRRNIIVFLQ